MGISCGAKTKRLTNNAGDQNIASNTQLVTMLERRHIGLHSLSVSLAQSGSGKLLADTFLLRIIGISLSSWANCLSYSDSLSTTSSSGLAA